MLRNSPLRILTALLVLLVLLVLQGCDFSEENNLAPSPTEPEVSVYSVDGQARVSGSTIVAEDRSSGDVAAVRFVLRSSTTGVSVESRSTSIGGEVTFSGLAPDTYEVEHEVTGTDGSAEVVVYHGLEVF